MNDRVKNEAVFLRVNQTSEEWRLQASFRCHDGDFAVTILQRLVGIATDVQEDAERRAAALLAGQGKGER